MLGVVRASHVQGDRKDTKALTNQPWEEQMQTVAGVNQGEEEQQETKAPVYQQ